MHLVGDQRLGAPCVHAAAVRQARVADGRGFVDTAADLADNALALNLAPTPWAVNEIVNWLMGSLSDRSINEVQFAAAIDIAAHVEKVSQVGGIAVTRSVAESLPDHRFAELAEMVDDQIVLLSLNPTLDPE